MSTFREIQEVYLSDIAKISKTIKKLGEPLGEMEKGERTLTQWLWKRRKSTKK